MIKEIRILFVLILIAFLYIGTVSAMVSDSAPPVSTVDYFTEEDELSNKRQCTLEGDFKKAYLNYNDVVGHGMSNDAISSIIEINTKLDNIAQELAICDDISCNDRDKIENWHTRTYFDLSEGWHELSGKAKDSLGHEETFNKNNLCMFCIDKQKPNAPSKPTLTREEFCDKNYINNQDEDIVFSWSATDNGCAGISFFDVFIELKRGDETSTTNVTVEGNSIDLRGINLELIDNDMVRIKVVAHDRAGNLGQESDLSEWVNVDNTEPKVEITNTNADEWITGNLEITEIDTDTNLFKCFYKVNVVNGDTTIDWTEISCNSVFTIDTKIICPVDGKNICRISKKVQDKACNEEITSKLFDIDNNPPELEKIISAPQYLEGKFVSTETPIEIIALDLASGVKELCYQINAEASVCINADVEETRELSTSQFNFEEESEHTLIFWAIDEVGNRKEMTQTHFVDNTPPITTKAYSLLFQQLGEFAGIEDFLMDWISSKTEITLTAQDPAPHPSNVKEILFNIMNKYEETDKETHSEWYGTKTRRWYDNMEMCEEENGDNSSPEPNPTPTNGENNHDEESDCVEVAGWENEEPMVYKEPIMIREEGTHKICFQSIDNVDNEEMQMCQVFFVDNTAPTIDILNPTLEESERIEKCSQSIVALVNDEDSGIKRVWAELWNEEEKVREVNMSRTIYGTYEALMDKQLPSGSYMLKVMAEDNVGNPESIEIEETLVDSVFVESIFPGQCTINPEKGGSCKFTFNVCMRDANAVSFSLDKLGGIITPAMMNAEISKGQDKTFIGLLDDRIESGMLSLSEETINGRTSFDVSLNIPINLASVIGKGVHPLNFHIKSFKK